MARSRYNAYRRGAYVVVDGVKITAPPVGLGSCCGRGMGALPVAAAASVVSAAGSIFNQHPKDKGRLAANQRYDAECRSGVTDACIALKHMSGRYGLTKQGRYCNEGGCSGWATGKTQDDAYSRCQSIGPMCTQAPYSAPVPVATAPAPLPSSVPGQNLPETVTAAPYPGAPPVTVYVPQPTMTPAPAGPAQQLPELVSYAQPAKAGISPAVAVVLGLVAVGMLSQNNRRARR